MTSQQLLDAAEFLGLFIVIGILVYAIRRMRWNGVYKFATGLALLASFLVLWVNLAVGIIGEPENPANLMYVGVIGVGFAGAVIGRFRPAGMMRAMFAAALAQVLVALITAFAGLGAPVTPLLSLLAFNGILTGLWAGSAWLFRKAALEPLSMGASTPGATA